MAFPGYGLSGLEDAWDSPCCSLDKAAYLDANVDDHVQERAQDPEADECRPPTQQQLTVTEVCSRDIATRKVTIRNPLREANRLRWCIQRCYREGNT